MGRQIKIVFDVEVVNYLDNLLYTLYKEDYFSNKATAKDYIIKIYSYIENNINTFPKRKTPKKLIHLGTNYMFYNSNQRTT